MQSVVISSRSALKMLAILALAAVAGCSSPHRLAAIPPDPQGLPDRVELKAVPVFRGNVFQSGPASLASMLGSQQVATTPGLLEKNLQLPQAEHQLEQNLQRVAREYGFLVYPLGDDFHDLMTQVAAGYPVLVRFDAGPLLFSKPRYGVLLGYDRFRDTVVLQSGMSARQSMSFSSFTSAWKSAGHWAVLIQNARQLPAKVDAQRWLRAADELARAGQEQAAAEARKTLARQAN
ncbi:peptidase C39 family protein [Pseudomonas sp. DTU_2021_1001937_2_SI_NGA_ILE_001]|uniref:peptidase C39 family protein n=1 Tax=Pseudomonas sp. DTU_2021_1001937_2_SI_NGA_ILE_001 TaxID=3077589 RepID=UPI0028FC1F4A|nr:peptidase C39 family protein [Pseudomonas sp. DTU_2021_1001937_2_SI_NGA_ILE_001]WNW10484.1 peptidase C39 family protein [Pseudomonas sp. DTU_2021_1001937_2_SI_NGA_ILE_001]